MTGKAVDFYFDYGSPAAYLAWTQIGRICNARGAAVHYKPVVLGAVFKATGNAPPVSVPAKGRYLLTDLQRWAKRWGVPFAFNPHFPVDTVALMKVAYGVLLRMPERFEDFNRATFRALWVDGLDLHRPEVAAGVLAQAGFDAQAVWKLGEDPEVRAGIRATTEEAVRRGAFGAPTFFVGDEMFWGQDRLAMVEEALAAG